MLRVDDCSILTDVPFHISITCQAIAKMRKSNLLFFSLKSMLFTTIVYLVVRTSADTLPTSEKTEYFHEQQSEHPSTKSSSHRRKTLQSRIDIQAVNVHSLPERPPPYVRTSNDFYERLVARPTWTSDSGSKETNLHEYPDIYKNKGNVFKPKPLKPGPWVTMTKGEIWPKPKYQQINSTFLILDVSTFRINVSTVHLYKCVIYLAILKFYSNR